MLILVFGCAMPASDSAAPSDSTAPGAAVPFEEVAYGEVGAPASVPDAEPCVTARVAPAASEPELSAILDEELQELALPSGIDWATEGVLVAYIESCTHGGQALEMTDVWDLGGGALQVDLTFHEGAFGTAQMSRAYTIATVPAGTYTATAEVTVDSSDTGFGTR